MGLAQIGMQQAAPALETVRAGLRAGYAASMRSTLSGRASAVVSVLASAGFMIATGAEFFGHSASVEPAPERPAPDGAWVRGKCPRCGAPLVSNLYYRGAGNYIMKWECWHSMQHTGPDGKTVIEPTCGYWRVL